MDRDGYSPRKVPSTIWCSCSSMHKPGQCEMEFRLHALKWCSESSHEEESWRVAVYPNFTNLVNPKVKQDVHRKCQEEAFANSKVSWFRDHRRFLPNNYTGLSLQLLQVLAPSGDGDQNQCSQAEPDADVVGSRAAMTSTTFDGHFFFFFLWCRARMRSSWARSRYLNPVVYTHARCLPSFFSRPGASKMVSCLASWTWSWILDAIFPRSEKMNILDSLFHVSLVVSPKVWSSATRLSGVPSPKACPPPSR